MLDFDVVDGWQDELEKMKEGKEGAFHSRLQHFAGASTVWTSGRTKRWATTSYRDG
jgi:hypothetical protein